MQLQLGDSFGAAVLGKRAVRFVEAGGSNRAILGKHGEDLLADTAIELEVRLDDLRD